MARTELPCFFLGEPGTTFSHHAFLECIERYGIPVGQTYSVTKNQEILPAVLAHGGYAILASRTMHHGKIEDTFTSYLQLLDLYDQETCPIQIIGSISLPVHFCLMSRSHMQLSNIKGVVGHKMALKACEKHISSMGIPIEEIGNNGLAVKKVADDEQYSECAALAPASAAHSHHLHILSENFEDTPTKTTFHLIGPRSRVVCTGSMNRSILLFSLKNEPGALLKALLPIYQGDLNIRTIHSVDTGDNVSRFALKIDVPYCKLADYRFTLERFRPITEKFIHFGPYELYDVDTKRAP